MKKGNEVNEPAQVHASIAVALSDKSADTLTAWTVLVAVAQVIEYALKLADRSNQEEHADMMKNTVAGALVLEASPSSVVGAVVASTS